MKRRWPGCLLPFALSALLAACGGKDAVAPPMPKPQPQTDPAQVIWPAEPGGVRLRIEATPDLNAQDGNPLALSLCVYQLGKADKFDDLARNADGLDALQACTVEAGGAVSAKRYWLQPGQVVTDDVDRAEGARLMAVAAGYAHLTPELSRAAFRFLLHSEKKGWMIGFRDTVYSAAPMEIHIRLTASQVSINGAEREPE
jgi:type VI secretion system VasD/TssJ family lipoprotein